MVKYNQPYGGAIDAPYVNGDPSIGRAGSIPPAAAIENPQRELVNLINDVALATATDTDLHQLAKAIQSQKLISKDDSGTANAYSVTLVPAPTAYFKYMTVVMQVTNVNTGASVINVNALGNKNITHTDLSAIVAGELRAGAIVCLVYDGTQFQMVWSTSVAGAPIFLTASKVFYVNASTGNDAWDGTSATFVSGLKGPWATLQHAMDFIVSFNLNGFDITVNVANGTYTGGLRLKQLGGSGTINWLGNAVTPASVLVSTTNKTAMAGADAGKSHVFNGFKFAAANGGSPVDEMAGIIVQGNTTLGLINTEYGACVDAQVKVLSGARVRFGGLLRLAGSASTFLTVYQNATVDQYNIAPSDISLAVVGSITYTTTFALVTMLGSFSFIWLNTTNIAGCTAKRYQVETNGVINVSGGGAAYLPGGTAGTTASGGQYV